MYYVALLFVCSVSAGYVGDAESGATCIKFFDRPEIQYPTLTDCSKRVREILEAVTADTERLHQRLPGPWRYSGKCVVAVIEEYV